MIKKIYYTRVAYDSVSIKYGKNYEIKDKKILKKGDTFVGVFKDWRTPQGEYIKVIKNSEGYILPSNILQLTKVEEIQAEKKDYAEYQVVNEDKPNDFIDIETQISDIKTNSKTVVSYAIGGAVIGILISTIFGFKSIKRSILLGSICGYAGYKINKNGKFINFKNIKNE